MAIDAKVLFLNDISKELGNEVTANSLNVIMNIISSHLVNYDLERMESDSADEDDLLDTYISALKIMGRSEKTIGRYEYLLKRMMEFVKVSTNRITVYHLRRYLASEKERGISDSTLDGYRQVYSSYFNWLQREGLIDKNPTVNLGSIKAPKRIKKAFTSAEVEQLKMGCDNIRDRAIICFLMSTGCRISEVTQLNRDNVNLDALECTVIGKGDKERVVYLDEVAALTLKQYFDTRTDDNPCVFVGRCGRLTPDGVRRILKDIAAKVNVDNVHPHRFRRTLATNLIRHGMTIQEVANILGHDKLDTTMKYVVLDKQNTKNAYNRFA